VDPLWKAGGGVSLNPKTLEDAFPTQGKEKQKRVQLWKELDNNGNSFVSLAEFDSWFNNYTKRYEDANRKKGSAPAQPLRDPNKSTIYGYARPCLIRAFVLANSVAPASESRAVPDINPDDFVTQSEFCVLLLAVQFTLKIYRIFDVLDISDDRRISKKEWSTQLPAINGELSFYGYHGTAMVESDFEEADADAGGKILLDEAVSFFLTKLCKDSTLLQENKKLEAVRLATVKGSGTTPEKSSCCVCS